jgi:hypothetical protein
LFIKNLFQREQFVLFSYIIKNLKNPKKNKKPHFDWVFLDGFFGWDFIGNPACAKSRRFMWRSTRSGQRSSNPHRVPCTSMGWNI